MALPAAAAAPAPGAGTDGCPCVDASPVLASLVGRACALPSSSEDDDALGVLLTVDGPCVPRAFGSSRCLPHDLDVGPDCVRTEGGPPVAARCHRPWCYVDAEACVDGSDERVFRSTYFPPGIDLFWSYSACGPSASDYLPAGADGTDDAASSLPAPLGGAHVKGIAAAYNILPWVYKRDGGGEVPSVPGDEYYDNR